MFGYPICIHSSGTEICPRPAFTVFIHNQSSLTQTSLFHLKLVQMANFHGISTPEFTKWSQFLSERQNFSNVKWSPLAHPVITENISVQELHDPRTDIFCLITKYHNIKKHVNTISFVRIVSVVNILIFS